MTVPTSGYLRKRLKIFTGKILFCWQFFTLLFRKPFCNGYEISSQPCFTFPSNRGEMSTKKIIIFSESFRNSFQWFEKFRQNHMLLVKVYDKGRHLPIEKYWGTAPLCTSLGALFSQSIILIDPKCP